MPQDEPPHPDEGRALLPALAALPGHLLWRAHARVLLLVAAKLPDGVDVHSWATLLALADGRARSQQSLAEVTKVSRTTMAKVAAALADQGLVERIRNPTDKRSYALTRTRDGAAAVRRWEEHVLALEDAVVGAFTEAERTELRDLLLAAVRDELAPDAPEELVASIGFLVTRAHFGLHREFLAALEPLGVEPRHFAALTALTATGPVPQAELARQLGVSAAAVVQIVDDLEAGALVVRRRLPADRRSHVLHLTERATALLPRAAEVAAQTSGARLAPLGDAGTARLVELLRRFVAAPPPGLSDAASAARAASSPGPDPR